MKRIPALLAILIIAAGCGADEPAKQGPKIYVANEMDGTVSVIDEASSSVIATIDMRDPEGQGMNMPMAHNVQVSPDGRHVWVTTPPMHEHEGEAVVRIDPLRDQVMGHIRLGTELFLAHVVFDPSSAFAFVSATSAEQVLKIDVNTGSVVNTWPLAIPGSVTPNDKRAVHGLRYCHGALYVAGMNSGLMLILDPETGAKKEVQVGGMAIQTACGPNGFVFVSLYDTKEVVRYNIQTEELTRIALPAQAEGPIQLYPSPKNGSQSLYVADQGMLESRPASNKLFEIDMQTAAVVATMDVGMGAHGVVVRPDGERVYVSNAADNSMSVVDAAKRSVISTVSVGMKPNGIGYWFEEGGMP